MVWPRPLGGDRRQAERSRWRLKCFRGLTQGWTDPHSRAVDTSKLLGRQTGRQEGMKVGPGQARPESAVVYYSLVMASTNVGRLRRRPVVMSGTPRPAACAVGLLRFRLMSEGWAAHWYSSLSTFHPRHLGCPQIARGLSQNQTRPLSRSPQTLLLEGFPPKSFE